MRSLTLKESLVLYLGGTLNLLGYLEIRLVSNLLNLVENKRVTLIVCVAQNAIFLDETINSLKYAEKAKKMKPVESRVSLI